MNAFRYVHDVWLLWVSLFQPNQYIGTQTNTAAVALIVLIGIAGWIIGKAFGNDPGVR